MTRQDPLSPARTPDLRPLGSIARVATTLLFVSCAANLFATWTDWRRYRVVADYVAGEPGMGVADLVSADNLAMGAAWLTFLALAAAATVFLTWLWRARLNAERLCRAEHRRSRGWTIGAWFVPVVNLWFPRQVVDDIWRTSKPGVPADTYRVDGLGQSPLVRAWWYTILADVLVVALPRIETRGAVTIEDLRSAALYGTVSTLLLLVAAILLSQVIRQVTHWHTIRREHR
ncbi:DUF4328 domain-containing protein [Actinophytocola glycyrrhizae]|uniref:DUF4328 domain-containing protein n=1 Tax=Actinophytocola glycyrrhizae TaxID=2044873 RepID=A0ABV9RW47_9PSEU